jgi:hypothetical protein
MTPLLCHLIGDYVLQSQPMADRKLSSMTWALIHAVFYSLPFAVLLTLTARSAHDGAWAWVVIAGTHALIDRYRIAARWMAWYGTGTRAGGLWGHWNVSTDPVPPFLSVWLTIIVDNTMHLAINALAVWLATGAP